MSCKSMNADNKKKVANLIMLIDTFSKVDDFYSVKFTCSLPQLQRLDPRLIEPPSFCI